MRSLEKGFQKIDSEILTKVADKYGAKYVPETRTHISASSGTQLHNLSRLCLLNQSHKGSRLSK